MKLKAHRDKGVVTGKNGKYPVLSRTNLVKSGVLIKRFIQSWNFANPEWSSLPPNFPYLSKSGLTKEEGHLLDAIKTAWIIEGGGRVYFYKKAAKVTFSFTVLAISLISLISLITSPTQNLTKEVSAKTVSRAVGNIVEATKSAVFRR